MTIAASRYTGSAEACFADFNERYPHLRASELLADFCQTNIAVVQRWKNGEYFPRGEQLLHLRCFLVLAGYEVTEVQRLRGEAKQLAMLVGLGLVEPREAGRFLGYNTEGNPTHSLWRVTLMGGGFTETVRKKIVQLQKKHAKQLEVRRGEWLERITKIIGKRNIQPEPTTDTQAILVPTVATAFSRMVGATIALGTALIDAGEERAVQEATRGGQDMAELAKILQRLSE